MSFQEQMEEAATQAQEAVDAIAADSKRWTQQESIDIYEMVRDHCQSWIDTIRQEMGE